QVAAKQMVGLYLSVWVTKTILPQIRGVQVTAVGTGVMGFLGNKGAVAVRMRVFDTGVELINAHLSSGESEGDKLKRHSDFLEIIRRGQYPPDSDAKEPETSLACDQTFWVGDLNYRLNFPDKQVREQVRLRKFDALAEHDELVQAREAGDAFQGWCEGALTFPPTYKFRCVRDTVYKDRRRTPAWTDRVLWRSKGKSSAPHQLIYASAMDIMMSDHRLVYAAFVFPVSACAQGLMR
ncbi:DNase I-like protein, partial [Coccomyxa subellipsoidea C-169]